MDSKKIVQIVVGALILFVSYKFFFGSGIFNGLFANQVDDGKLGAGPADFMSQALEIAATILAAIGGIGMASATQLIKWITGAFGDSIASSSGPQSNSTLDNALAKLLVQSAIDGDRALTVVMAQKIAGTSYIDGETEK